MRTKIEILVVILALVGAGVYLSADRFQKSGIPVKGTVVIECEDGTIIRQLGDGHFSKFDPHKGEKSFLHKPYKCWGYQ